MNPNQLTYRKDIRVSDRDTIRRIVSSSGFFSREEIDLAMELVDDRLSRGSKSDYCYILADNGRHLVGFTCYGRIPATQSSYDLYWIATDVAFRRGGIGKMLMLRTEDIIGKHGGRQVYIETSGRPQYTPTRLFYEACGYIQVAFLRDYYASGDDKIIYVKTLKNEDSP